jgi:hypothetical protein
MGACAAFDRTNYSAPLSQDRCACIRIQPASFRAWFFIEGNAPLFFVLLVQKAGALPHHAATALRMKQASVSSTDHGGKRRGFRT